ncbi:MAG TPA: DUF1080 domain-containing protein [Chitinophagaceae bacterium]|nr:DUF1080 domain-containing protein [Chitinophagaceae bacterium]
MKALAFFWVGIFTTIVFSANAQQTGDPKATEVWEPVPKMVTTGTNNQPPSDAIVLFNGKDLSAWSAADGAPAKWKVEDNSMVVTKGTDNIQTKQGFGDCQLHVEWQAPAVVEGEGQGRGNSGIFLMGNYEVQVLDSYNNRTYSNGQAASIYKQYIPLVNASKKPGEWQTYDIIFTAPRFNDDGSVKSPAFVTVLHNGVLVQNHVELKGGTVYIGQPAYKKHGDKEPIVLQDHGNPVKYRNIWIREL